METYLTIFIAVTALAVVMQAGILVGAYLRLAKLDEETKPLRRQISEQIPPILRNVDDITVTVREKSRELLYDATALTQDARRQMEKFDRLTDEVADRLRLQIIRLDELLTQAMENIEQAGSTVKESVVGPVKEATAVLQGVRAAIDFLGARRDRTRRKGQRIDEELFI